MKKTTKTRLLAFILTLCITLGTLPLYVFADGTDAELPEQITQTENENLTAFQLGIGEKSVTELENMTLSAADIPASISRETVEAKDHVLRLREQEADLNTVIFQNRDGGKTVYLFGSPVKYVDADGNIRDKSTTLVSENVTINGKTYAHSATDNFFGQYYPTMPQNGVMLAFGPYTIEMTPVITGVLTLRDTVVADNKVTYNKVFGTGTSLVYTPTLNGVKEDIILQAYTGKSSFSFTLKTNGLAVIQTENDTFLADFEGNKVASLGDVIITDSANHTAYGTMTVVTKTEREEYTVTINAPVEFLTAPTTVYPVTVDPTLSIYDHNTFMDDYGNSVEIIHDMCIYQNGSATSPISTIGSLYYDEDSCEMETARMLYRLNPYYFSSSDSPLLYMTSPRFESASLFTTVSLGQESSVTVDIYPYNAIWSYEENVYGDQIYSNGTTADYTSNPDYNNLIGSVCASTTVYYTEPMETEFDITPIVNYWIASSSDSANDDHPTYEYGFVMRLPEEEGSIEKLSVWQSEYSGTSVYIAIDYNNLSGSYYVNSCDTGKFLTGSSTAPVTQSTYGSEAFQGWTFTYNGDNLYEITLTANSNRILYMDSSYNVAIGTRSSLNSANYTWQLSFYYNYVTIRNQATGKYLYAPEDGTSLGGTSSVSLAHWRMCKTSAYVPLTSFSVADIVMEVGETVTPTITVTPGNATWASVSDFTWSSDFPEIFNISDNGNITSLRESYICFKVIHKSTGLSENVNLRIDSNEELFSAVKKLYECANSYAPNTTTAYKYYLVMSFIRYEYTGYTTDLWELTTGNVGLYSGFISYVRTQYPSFDNLFPSLLRAPLLIDNNNKEIDFYHLIATLNGMLFVDVYPEKIATLGKNFAGWAGDLQSLVPHMFKYFEEKNIESTYLNIYNYTVNSMTTETGSYFSSNDLYADIDAFCLYTSILNLQLSASVEYFAYHYVYNFNDRFTIFSSGNTKEELFEMVVEYLKWPLILGDGITLAQEQRTAIANAFVDTIWNAIQEERGS